MLDIKKQIPMWDSQLYKAKRNKPLCEVASLAGLFTLELSLI